MKPGPLFCRMLPALALALLLCQGAAAEAPGQAMLNSIADAYSDAWWARLLGWIAVTLGVLNLALLGYMVRGLARGGWSLLGDLEWPIVATRRRQRALGRSLGALNAQLEDLEADRPRLNDSLKVARENLRAPGADGE